MRGKLKIRKKILEKNKYKNKNDFSIHIANKSEIQSPSYASLLAITSLSFHRSFNSNEVQSKTGLNVKKLQACLRV